jgi:hypothetical protein
VLFTALCQQYSLALNHTRFSDKTALSYKMEVFLLPAIIPPAFNISINVQAIIRPAFLLTGRHVKRLIQSTQSL